MTRPKYITFDDGKGYGLYIAMYKEAVGIELDSSYEEGGNILLNKDDVKRLVRGLKRWIKSSQPKNKKDK